MMKEKINNFIPEGSLISFVEIAKHLKDQGGDVSVRTIRYYATENLLPKPMYIKKVAYYDREFILSELKAIYVLRTLFGKGISEIAALAKNAFGSLDDIVSTLHDILDKKDFKSLSKHKSRPLGFRYVNSPLLQFVAQEYFSKIKKGWWPTEMLKDKFIEETLEKYREQHTK